MKNFKNNLGAVLLLVAFVSCNKESEPSIQGFDPYIVIIDKVDNSLAYKLESGVFIYDADVDTVIISDPYGTTIGMEQNVSYPQYFSVSKMQSNDFLSGKYTVEALLKNGSKLSLSDVIEEDALMPTVVTKCEFSSENGKVITIDFEENREADAYSIALFNSENVVYGVTGLLPSSAMNGTYKIWESTYNWDTMPKDGDEIIIEITAYSFARNNGVNNKVAITNRTTTWGSSSL